MKKLNSAVLNATVAILDFLYRNRPSQRFWVLEVIARAPYFAFISVLHLRESLGLRGEEHIYLMKEHFYQALNETEHLEEMEAREGNKYWTYTIHLTPSSSSVITLNSYKRSLQYSLAAFHFA